MTATKGQAALTAVLAVLQVICGVAATGLFWQVFGIETAALGLPFLISGGLGGLAAHFRGTKTYCLFMVLCVLNCAGGGIWWLMTADLYHRCTLQCPPREALYILISIGAFVCFIGAIVSGATCCCGQIPEPQRVLNNPYRGVVFSMTQQHAYPTIPLQSGQSLYPGPAIQQMQVPYPINFFQPGQAPYAPAGFSPRQTPYSSAPMQYGHAQNPVTSSSLHQTPAAANTEPTANTSPRGQRNASKAHTNNRKTAHTSEQKPPERPARNNRHHSDERPIENVSELHNCERLQVQDLHTVSEDEDHRYEHLPVDVGDYENEQSLGTAERNDYDQLMN